MKHVEHADRNPRGHLVQRLQDCLDPFGFPGPETPGAWSVPYLSYLGLSHLVSELPHALPHFRANKHGIT